MTIINLPSRAAVPAGVRILGLGVLRKEKLFGSVHTPLATLCGENAKRSQITPTFQLQQREYVHTDRMTGTSSPLSPCQPLFR